MTAINYIFLAAIVIGFLCFIPTWRWRAVFLVFVGVCWWMVR